MKMKFDHRFTASFNAFIESLDKIVKDATQGRLGIAYEEGYKYIRIVTTSGESRQAWGFIDKRTADIYRAASWKAPCLNHTRGNLYDESNGLKYAQWTGPAYIWEINGDKKEEVAVSDQPAPGDLI
jgi:hypothetical protein